MAKYKDEVDEYVIDSRAELVQIFQYDNKGEEVKLQTIILNRKWTKPKRRRK